MKTTISIDARILIAIIAYRKRALRIFLVIFGISQVMFAIGIAIEYLKFEKAMVMFVFTALTLGIAAGGLLFVSDFCGFLINEFSEIKKEN